MRHYAVSGIYDVSRVDFLVKMLVMLELLRAVYTLRVLEIVLLQTSGDIICLPSSF
jgi:hypothetical protein